MGTSLTPDFKNSLAGRPGAGRSATSKHRSAGGLDRVYPVKELSGELGVRTPQANSKPGFSVLLPV